MFRGYALSKTGYYHKLQRANRLNCTIDQLLDGRGKQDHLAAGHEAQQGNGLDSSGAAA